MNENSKTQTEQDEPDRPDADKAENTTGDVTEGPGGQIELRDKEK